MYLSKLLIGLICLPLFAQGRMGLTPAEIESKAQNAVQLRATIEAAPKLPLEQTDIMIKLPEGQELGMVSWVARDPKTRVMWLLQRGDKADPVIAVGKEGRVLHSFGKGLYRIPHALRLDPQGNVWTVDAASSTVIKFSPSGEKLLQIDVGGQPESAYSAFRGTTDIAFAPKAGFSSAMDMPTRASLSTLPTAKRSASGAVRAPVRDSSICRTPSWWTKTISSMLPTARTGGLKNSTSTESLWARFPTWEEHIRSSWAGMGRYGRECSHSMSPPDLPDG